MSTSIILLHRNFIANVDIIEFEPCFLSARGRFGGGVVGWKETWSEPPINNPGTAQVGAISKAQIAKIAKVSRKRYIRTSKTLHRNSENVISEL